MPAAEVMLQARDIVVRFGDRTILDKVSLEVRAGEVVALVGPNGAGKSTLLNALTGDITPDDGTVELAGEPLKSLSVKTMARIRAVQLQENRVSFAFTAHEVVRLGRAAWAGTTQETRDDAVLLNIMESTEVTSLAQRPYPTLSGGEKARTTFARALAQETPVLLLDEPTAAMDIRHQEKVLAEARTRALAGAAVVVVLHDLSVAAAYSDLMVLLDQGRVQAAGTPREVLTAERISAVYQYPVMVTDQEGAGGPVVIPLRAPLSASSSHLPSDRAGQSAQLSTDRPRRTR